MPDEKPDVVDSGQKKSAIPVLLLVIGAIGGYAVGSVISGPEVSEDGQISYACALAEKVRASHQSEEDWGAIGEDRAFNEIAAIRPLLGGSAPLESDEDERFSDLDWSVLSEGRLGAWSALLEDVIKAC